MNIKKYFELPLKNGGGEKQRYTQIELSNGIEKSQGLIQYMIRTGEITQDVGLAMYKFTKPLRKTNKYRIGRLKKALVWENGE